MTRGSFAWFAHRVLKIITIRSNTGPWIVGTKDNQGKVNMASYIRAMHESDGVHWDGKRLAIIPYSQYKFLWDKMWQKKSGQPKPGEFAWPQPDELAKLPFP